MIGRRRPLYSGLEIDVLGVADADCILVTRWRQDRPTRVLIDGGNTSNAPMIKGFLEQRDAFFVDHVVNSHLDADHAGGLIPLVLDPDLAFGTGWMHLPELHLDTDVFFEAASRLVEHREARLLTSSLNHSMDLEEAFLARGVSVEEPFAFRAIGFLTVLGPSVPYYVAQLNRFRDLAGYIRRKRRRMIEAAATTPDELLLAPDTSPANNTSCIAYLRYDGGGYLWTADAGAEALEQANVNMWTRTGEARLGDLQWFQVPHHGSRKNITENLLRHFRPRESCVSASGKRGHPSAAVVEKLKELGSVVYSTHENVNLWFRRGSVPPRDDYADAIML